jgi:hypothetical protein
MGVPISGCRGLLCVFVLEKLIKCELLGQVGGWGDCEPCRRLSSCDVVDDQDDDDDDDDDDDHDDHDGD